MEDKNEFDQLADTGNEIDGTPSPSSEPNILDTMEPDERHKYIIEKMKLKNKILRYKELFPHLLQNFTYRLEDLDRMDIKDLNYLLEEISVAVNTRNSSGLTKMLYFESVRIVECGSKLIGLKVDGLQNALKDNQAIHDVLNELSLKYENDMYMAPEIRLAYLTSATILQLHKLNSSSSVINDFLSKKVPESVLKEFSDL